MVRYSDSIYAGEGTPGTRFALRLFIVAIYHSPQFVQDSPHERDGDHECQHVGHRLRHFHAEHAEHAGARKLPFPIPSVMALASKAMKTVAYRI